MPQEPTENCRYESSGGSFVTLAQRFAERMCQRLAASKGQDLPHKFWNHPRWKSEFLKQHRLILKLLKIFDGEAITRALRTKEGQKIYSFGFRGLTGMIQIEQDRLNAEKIRLEQAEVVKVEELPLRENFVGPSVMSRLKDIECQN